MNHQEAKVINVIRRRIVIDEKDSNEFILRGICFFNFLFCLVCFDSFGCNF